MTKPMPLRIAVDVSALADHRSTAGIGRYITALVAELGRRDDLAMLAVRPPWPPPHESWAVRFAAAQPFIAPRARLFGAALVHGMASDPALLWPLSRQVVTLHDVVPWTSPAANAATGRYLALQRRRLRRCGAVIAVSRVTADEAIGTLGLDPARVHVVPEAVSAVFSPTARDGDEELRHRAGAPPRYLLWVGSLRARDPRKGLDDLLEGLRLSRHADIPMLLAGTPGTESARLVDVGRGMGLTVITPGYVGDETLAALYRGAMAALLPSRHEGFGLTALEALASGTPLVAARAANLPGLVGDSAIQFTPGVPAELAAAIDSVVGDAAVAGNLRARGPVTASAYSWKHTADLTVQVYRELVASI